MNYTRIYTEIISNRINNIPTGYFEHHHIIPRSLGGTDNISNIVKLTAREHFLCHWLLVKIYQLDFRNHTKMLKAFSMMCFAINSQQHRNNNSRIFEKYRIEFSNMMSKLQSGENNSRFGTMWISHINDRYSVCIPKGKVPDGFVKGRNIWKLYYCTCIICLTEFRKKTRTRSTPKFCSKKCKSVHLQTLPKSSKLYKNGFRVAVNDIEYDSISHAADSLGIGHETARMRFKNKNFTEYKILSQ